MYVLPCLSVVTMRYSRDPLDVCFGDQLAGSAHEPMHRDWHTFSFDSPVETLGHSLRFYVLVE